MIKSTKDGIKAPCTFTRAYTGRLIADHGIHNIMKELKAYKDESVWIEDNIPHSVRPNARSIPTDFELKIFKFPFGKEHFVNAHWTPWDNMWNFWMDDEQIDIVKLLDQVNEESDGRAY